MVVLIYNNHIFNLIQKQMIIKFDIFLKLYNIHELYRSVSTLASDIIRISLTRHFLEPLRRKFISKCAFQGEINTNIYCFQNSKLLSSILFFLCYHGNQKAQWRQWSWKRDTLCSDHVVNSIWWVRQWDLKFLCK